MCCYFDNGEAYIIGAASLFISMCTAQIIKKCRQIRMKFSGSTDDEPGANPLVFEQPTHTRREDPDTNV